MNVFGTYTVGYRVARKPEKVFCCCENVKLHRSPLLCVHENDKLLSVAVFKSIYTNPQQPLYLNMYFI